MSYDLEVPVPTVKLPALLVDGAISLLDKAKSITITSDPDYIAASDFAAQIRAKKESTEKDRVDLKAPSLDAGRRIDAYFKRPIALLDEAFEQVKTAMKEWDAKMKAKAELERKRLEEQKRAQEAEERRKREEEAKAREEVLRKQREAADAQAAQERAKREAAEAESRRAAAAQREAEAKAKGDREAMERAEQEAYEANHRAVLAEANAEAEREKAIEARRAQLRAEREASDARQRTEVAAAEAAKPVEEVKPALTAVAGNKRKVVYKWKLRDGIPLQLVPIGYHKLDEDKVDVIVQRLKELAATELGKWFDIWTEDELTIGRKK